jgi:tRNA-Thr(GGU) m(6)t(6)A37 methyltransferase TsaA
MACPNDVTDAIGNKADGGRLASSVADRKCYQRPCLISQSQKGSWSSGYDVCLTRRSSPVRIRVGPLHFLGKNHREGTQLPEARLDTSLEDGALRLRRIATVVNGVSETAKDWHQVTSKLVFEKEYVGALFGLDRLKQIWVIFGLDRHRGWNSKVRPRCAKGNSLVGVFASRSGKRPNRLGLTLVDLVEVRGDTVTVKGLDAFDGSPVFDLKNYDEDYDLPRKRP